MLSDRAGEGRGATQKSGAGTSSPHILRILFIDDHIVVRTALGEMIRRHTQAEITTADSAAEAVSLLTQGSWDLVILELCLQGRDGLNVLLQARSINPKTPVLVLTIEREEQFAIRAIKMGAAGFLRKTCTWTELSAALDTVLKGQKAISPWLVQRMAQYMGAKNHDTLLHEALSDREFQVLRMIAAGKTVKEIGGELQLSAKTISTYRTRILEKMHFKKNSDLVGYCATHGLQSMTITRNPLSEIA